MQEIDGAIGRAALGLLLVSADSLASDFIMDVELPALAAQGVPLVCVLVRPCLWQKVPDLAQVQWRHDPRRDGPLSPATSPRRGAANTVPGAAPTPCTTTRATSPPSNPTRARPARRCDRSWGGGFVAATDLGAVLTRSLRRSERSQPEMPATAVVDLLLLMTSCNPEPGERR
jgi:hypothetical protein